MHLSQVQVGRQQRHNFKSINLQGMQYGAPNGWTCHMASTGVGNCCMFANNTCVAQLFCTKAMQAGYAKTTCPILVDLFSLHSCNCLQLITSW